MSTGPSPRAGSIVLGDRVDGVSRCVHGLPRPCVFCSRSYWPMMLLWAGMLVLLWFALGPSNPYYALMVVGWTWVLGPGVAGPVMRRLPRQWFRVPAGERVLHRSWALEHSAGCSSAPDGIAISPNPCGDSMAAGPAYSPWNGRCEALPVPTEPASPSTYYWPPSHFSPGTGGAHCGCYCQVWFLISIRCCYSAPSCFDSSLCWISPAPEIRT